MGDAGHCPFGKARCDGCTTQGKYLILDVAISEDLFLGVFRKNVCMLCAAVDFLTFKAYCVWDFGCSSHPQN